VAIAIDAQRHGHDRALSALIENYARSLGLRILLINPGLPRAYEVPSFEMDENPVPTKTNPLGAKGAGEARNVGALAAIMNAVVDALSPLGIAHIDMPATPEKVWRAIRATQAR